MSVIMATSVVMVHLMGSPMRVTGLTPIQILPIALSFVAVALGLVRNTSSADPASLEKWELRREIRLYKLRSFAVILPLLLGTLVATVTPVGVGITAMTVGVSGLCALSVLHSISDNPKVAAAVRSESRRRDYQQSIKAGKQVKELVAGKTLGAGAAVPPANVDWWTALAGWILHIVFALGVLLLLKLTKSVFPLDSIQKLLVAIVASFLPALAYLYAAQYIRLVRYVRVGSEVVEHVFRAVLYVLIGLIYQLAVLSELLEHGDVRYLVVSVMTVVGVSVLLYRLNVLAARTGEVTLLTPVAAGWHRYYAKRNAALPPRVTGLR
ncbi:hypothetical protein ABH922_005728 [Rhodococcus sp. 27YEA15]|uniref:hypothetical protein n=1 Tax=Rhodococcus sp. 27YEA15 TaxID=3156259 RepID=UPI003C7E6954